MQDIGLLDIERRIFHLHKIQKKKLNKLYKFANRYKMLVKYQKSNVSES